MDVLFTSAEFFMGFHPTDKRQKQIEPFHQIKAKFGKRN